jgi:Ca2+-binding RTX toxin-like protein
VVDIPANFTTNAGFEGDLTATNTHSGSYSGALETSGDRDWIEVYLVAGFGYTFAPTSLSPTDPAGASVRITLFDPSGVSITSAGGAFTETIGTSGRYFIQVSSTQNHPAEYTVSVNTGGPGTAIRGDSGHNVLTGAATTIFGGLGNDTLTITGQGKLFGEAGNDALAGSNVDLGTTIVDLLFGGPGADSLSGNNGRDRLEGGDGNDTISGGAANDLMFGGLGNDLLNGGTGSDSMAGEAGDDTYIVDNPADVVSEFLATGNDIVVSSISFSLSSTTQAFGDLERLTLTGTAAINGTGNALANAITGNVAANLLIGGLGNDVLSGGNGSDTLRGAQGNDTLIGGSGNNVFVFDTAPSTSANRDVIADFTNTSGNNDIFHLENAVFAKLGGGATHPLNPAFFRAGAAALDANDFIVYNKATGILSYDVNGNGAGGAVQLAVLIGKPTLTAGDFLVI